MASMTPGRKLSTGMDCRMSSTAIMKASTRGLYAAIVAVADGEDQAEQVGDADAHDGVEGVERQGTARSARSATDGTGCPNQ